jgi:hypothetical protein
MKQGVSLYVRCVSLFLLKFTIFAQNIKHMRSAIRFSTIIVCTFLFTTSYSCRKKNTLCTASIKVVRQNGAIVSGAKVKMTSNEALSQSKPLADYLPDTKLTDATGFATFEFKYPAILDVEVTHVAYGIGADLIKLEEGESVSKTIVIQ